jgi:PadR family transcriptional regulator PadR
MGKESVNDILGPFEEAVLLTVLSLSSDAYGVRIRQQVETAVERSISIGALYTTLERLERKGYISASVGEPTPERGGRAKRFYRIEGAGEVALSNTQAFRSRIYRKLTPGLQT